MLKDEFDGSSEKVAVFQEQLLAKCNDFGWNNNDTSDVVNLPLDPAVPIDTRNLVLEFAQLTVTAITAWAIANVVNVQSCQAQNNYNMYRSLFNSLDSDTQAIMALEKGRYTVANTVVAALFYKLLMSKAEVRSHADRADTIGPQDAGTQFQHSRLQPLCSGLQTEVAQLQRSMQRSTCQLVHRV